MTSKIERHPQRAAIERALAGPQTLAEIGARYALRIDELCRYRSKLKAERFAYFESLRPGETTADRQQLIAALVEIAAAIDRAARILSV